MKLFQELTGFTFVQHLSLFLQVLKFEWCDFLLILSITQHTNLVHLSAGCDVFQLLFNVKSI